MYRPLTYRVHFKACAREGKDFTKLLRILDGYKNVTYIVKNNCVYFDSKMDNYQISNLGYELFKKGEPNNMMYQDFESIYIITDGDIYGYYDRWMAEQESTYGPLSEPPADKVIDEINEKIKEVKQKLGSS